MRVKPADPFGSWPLHLSLELIAPRLRCWNSVGTLVRIPRAIPEKCEEM